MLAKPGHGTGSRAEQSTALACEQILSLCPGFDLEQELLPIIAAVADAAAPRVSALPALVGASRNQPPPIDCGPREELSRSLQIAQGKRAPDLGWALGQAWRSVYPAIVERLSGGGLSESDRLAFRALAGQMERVAFGPPAVNAAKLLALVDAGKVDLCFVSGAELTAHKHRSALRLGGFARPVDVVVDAVLPPPGAVGPLADLLLARGYAHTSAGRRGIEVMADGECVAPDGGRLPGLSAAGRITEDCIVGNDTLNRALHPLLDRWAARVTASESARQPA
jgi:diaminopimelate decarboxylase